MNTSCCDRVSAFMQHLRLSPLQLGAVCLNEGWSYADLCAPYWRLYHNPDPGAWIQQRDAERILLHPDRMYVIPAWIHFAVGGGAGQRHHFMHFDIQGIPAGVQRRVFNSIWSMPGGLHAEQFAETCIRLVTLATTDEEACVATGSQDQMHGRS